MDHSNLPPFVILTDVGPRDGLQSISYFIPTHIKIKLIENLVKSGLKNIQITSFVNPKLVPQFRDAEYIASYFSKNTDIYFSALVLNMKGLYRAISSGIRGVEISISANDEFSFKNTKMNKDNALEEIKKMLLIAKENNMYIRGSIQCCFGYKYEDDVSIDDILNISEIFITHDIDEIVYADTSAMANPRSIYNFFSFILKYIDREKICMHYHSNMNMGLVNMYCSIQYGIYRFDTSFGFLGGCPFIDNARQNISTEEAINLLKTLGIYTGIDEKVLEYCNKLLNQVL